MNLKGIHNGVIKLTALAVLRAVAASVRRNKDFIILVALSGQLKNNINSLNN